MIFKSGICSRAMALFKLFRNFSYVNGPPKRAFLLCNDVFNIIIANDKIKQTSIQYLKTIKNINYLHFSFLFFV